MAEDVLQEAYIRVWRHASAYDSTLGQPMAWLATIVRRLAIDALRRRGPLDQLGESGSMHEAVEEAVVLDEVIRAMDARIGTVKSHIRRGLQHLRRCLQP